MGRELTPFLTAYLPLVEQDIYYRLYRHEAASSRRLLLLHGGGVAGRLTWGGILPYLNQWSEILVPDLRGTGKTRYPDRYDHGFEAEEVVGDMAALAERLGWERFDLGGYSYGGLIAMLLKQSMGERVGKTFLFEPALLGKMRRDELAASRDLLLQAAQMLKDAEQTEAGLEIFLDAVAPNRRRGGPGEAVMRERLSRRPAGLACAVECVSHASRRLDREALIAAQTHVSSFIGERSHPDVFAYCQRIAAERADWRCHLIQGADHALPFQKPEPIARLMNADLVDYLAA
jgi:pimeloyl-ACP methyl ester carboxylesterase